MRNWDTPQRGVFRFFPFIEGLGCEVANFAERDLNGGKNSVNVGTVDGTTHKGVETPHVQKSTKNVNPQTGEVFINKNRKDVRPMTQQDIRTVRKVLEKRQQSNNEN